MSSNVLVFVYGTLKSNNYNHYLLEQNETKYIEEGVTRPAFQMIGLGGYPAVVNGKNKIHGEIYKVEEKTINILDSLELPYGYEKQYRIIKGTSTDTYYDCVMYVATKNKEKDLLERVKSGHLKIIESGDWEDLRKDVYAVEKNALSR
jgi:gamma-glutamylcyclotransferase (GGCT)/AIG2-like uncharacterized protein YtfP